MANILKVTTPIGGYENSGNVRANPEMKNPMNVQGPVNPEKVVRSDARSDAATEREEEGFRFKYETNFDNFIQQLRTASPVTQEIVEILKQYQAAWKETGIRNGSAESLAQLLESLEMDSAGMLDALKNQGKTAVRYEGAFFQILRQIMKESRSVEVRNGVLKFLKHYTDMAESEVVLKDIRRSLNEIQMRMLPKQSEQLSAILERMVSVPNGAEDVGQNLVILKTEILPFLNQYISEMHERGVMRDMTAQIAEFTSRYESGQSERVQAAFEKLLEYPAVQRYFKEFDVSRLMEILANTEFERASGRCEQMDRLIRFLEQEVTGDNKQVFTRLIQSMVLNESVYMPVLHMMMPFSMDGRVMFSEMWIDPDAENKNGEGVGGRERTVKGLVKFEIQDVGFFDLVFIYQNEKVSLQLNVPSSLDAETIKDSVQKIVEEHSLMPEEIVVGRSDIPVPVTQVFEKIIERKNSINVSI